MRNLDAYDRWTQARAEAPVPDGFAERMATEASRRIGSRVSIAIAIAASAVFALRIASTFLVFVAL
jgi:hypothetical protein